MPQAVFLGCVIVVLFACVSTTQSLKVCPLRCRVRSVPATGTVPFGFGGVGARMTSCCVAGENMDCVSELIADYMYPLVFNFRFTRGAG